MYQLLLILLVVVAFLLIGLILIQHGKGAQTGASFGSGASQTVFGSQGSGNFLSRSTALLAATFFIINLTLAYLTNKEARKAPLSDLVPVGEQVIQEQEEKKDVGDVIPE